MSESDRPKADPRLLAGYLATLAGITAVAWLTSRIARPPQDPWMGEGPDPR